MGPRFKGRLDVGEDADVWDRLEKAAVANAAAAVAQIFHCMYTSMFFASCWSTGVCEFYWSIYLFNLFHSHCCI